jgi:hypothetical protein
MRIATIITTYARGVMIVKCDAPRPPPPCPPPPPEQEEVEFGKEKAPTTEKEEVVRAILVFFAWFASLGSLV